MGVGAEELAFGNRFGGDQVRLVQRGEGGLEFGSCGCNVFIDGVVDGSFIIF